MERTIRMPEKEYRELKIRTEASDIDVDLLRQFVESLKDIKEGRVRRVK